MKLISFLIFGIFALNVTCLAQSNSRYNNINLIRKNPLDTLFEHKGQFVRKEFIYLGSFSQTKVNLLVVTKPFINPNKCDIYLHFKRIDNWNNKYVNYALISYSEINSLIYSMESMRLLKEESNYTEYKFNSIYGAEIGCFYNRQSGWKYFFDFNNGIFSQTRLTIIEFDKLLEIAKKASVVGSGYKQ